MGIETYKDLETYGQAPLFRLGSSHSKDSLLKLVGEFKYSLRFFLAEGELLLQYWRNIYKTDTPPSLLNAVNEGQNLTQKEAEKACSIVCIKVKKECDASHRLG